MIMPLVNGMDTARELRQSDTAVRLVFLTSSPEFALESYEVRAFDYLLKPVTYERLAQLLDELSSMRPAATDELVIKTSFGYHARACPTSNMPRRATSTWSSTCATDAISRHSSRSAASRTAWSKTQSSLNATAATRSTCAISITLTARRSS